MKYSIIMPYLSREVQLWNTLLTLEHWYELRGDYEVIIVPDAKNTPEDIKHLELTMSMFNVPSRTVQPKSGNWNSPGPHYNVGVVEARGTHVILTSPEIMHKCDVLGMLDKHNLDEYIVCACENVSTLPRIETYEELVCIHKQWYQHSVFRPSNYHFCTCIRRDTYIKIGGFDEAFGPGIAFDDNDWRDNVIVNGVKVTVDDNIRTAHQDHKHFVLGPTRLALWEPNRALYAKKCEERGITWNEN